MHLDNSGKQRSKTNLRGVASCMLERMGNPSFCVGMMTVALLLSFCTQLSLAYVDPSVAYEGYHSESRALAFWYVLSNSTSFHFPEDIAYVLVVFAIVSAFASLPRTGRRSLSAGCLAILFSAFMVVGGYFSGTTSAFDVYELFKMAIVFFGFAGLFYCSLCILIYVLDARSIRSFDTPGSRLLSFVFEERPFLAPLAIILLAWLPYLILCYPGTTDPYDVLDQLQQYHGIYSRTAAWVEFPPDSWLYVSNNNPFFSTFLTNSFIDFGSFIGSQNIGMFLMVILQTLVLSTGFAFAVYLQRLFKTPYLLRVASLLTFAFAPLFPCYAICITKDTLFSALVLWCVLLLIVAAFKKDRFLENKWLFVAYFIVSLLMVLIRNNGVYMLLFVVPFAFLSKSFQQKILASLSCVVIALYFAYGSFLLPYLGVQPGSVKETLSVPFQQTARYVAHYGDEVTPDEREAIDAVLDYDGLAAGYTPTLSDPVKETFKKTASEEDLREYFQVWMQMGLKHPGTYVAATLQNTYLYFYPDGEAGWVWTQLNRCGAFDSDDLSPQYFESGFMMAQNEEWEPYRSALTEFYEMVKTSPLGATTNMGVCSWAVILLAALVVRRHKLKAIAPFMPIIALLLVCVMSPQNGNIRYALPLIVTMFPLVSYGLWSLGNPALKCDVDSEES